MSIRYTKSTERECDVWVGGHRCVKDWDHAQDCTNDDHQCCCGHTWEETA